MKKVIVITGASSGFGVFMTKTFAEQGFTVIATMRNPETKNAVIAKSLTATPNVEVVEMDVINSGSVKTAIAGIVQRHGKIDVLINNAGVYGGGLLEGYSLTQFKKMMDVNLYGVLRLYGEVLPVMRAQQDGLIINISSGLGRISAPFSVPYNATKFALEGLTEGSYLELIGQGIETVLIEPGPFPTELHLKEGVNADRSDVLESYGEQTKGMLEGFGGMFKAAISRVQPDPQLIADAALTLVNTEKGKRPLRTPLDLISNSVDLEYDEKTTEIKRRWLNGYGF
jgi:NAD(P)-dependent dehydrogenase (short-subunit alcohol dehydrogenase family)